MERSSIPADPHHALLPPAITPQFSSFINAELDRITSSISQKQQSSSSSLAQPAPDPLRAIDLTRYQHHQPSTPTPTHTADQLEAGLSQAYTAMTYLSARRQHLALLDSSTSSSSTTGKNAWLTANWQLEAELRAVERELAATRREIDVLTVRRQRAQQGDVAAEMRALDDNWRRGVGRVLEAEVAAEGVRRGVVEEQRRRAQQGSA